MSATSAILLTEVTAVSGSNHVLNLVLAILVTVFCCQPVGIAAIVFAAIAMYHDSAGNYDKAASFARTARLCIWIAFGVGLVGTVLVILLHLLIGLGSLLLLVPFLAVLGA